MDRNDVAEGLKGPAEEVVDRRRLMEIVAQVAPVLADEAGLADRERGLTKAAGSAMRDAGLYRLTVPRGHGGWEVHPLDAYAVWEELAAVDSAAAWNLHVSCSASAFLAALPGEVAEEVFSAGPDVAFAGVSQPPGVLEPVEGGYRFTARVPFMSGAPHADWMFLPGRFEGGAPQMVLVAAAQLEVLDTWDTMGLRGTGSHDVVADRVFVPARQVAPFTPGSMVVASPAFAGELYRFFPWWGLQGLPQVAVGVARSALETMRRVALAKRSGPSGALLAETEAVQRALGRGLALVEAARATVEAAARAALEEMGGGAPLDRRSRARLQMSACFATEAAVSAVDGVYEALGSASYRTGQGIEQCFRDVHVAALHATHAAARYAAVGQVALDLDSEWALLGRGAA